MCNDADTLNYSWHFVDQVVKQEVAHHGVVDTGIALDATTHLELHDATAEGLEAPFTAALVSGFGAAWLAFCVCCVLGARRELHMPPDFLRLTYKRLDLLWSPPTERPAEDAAAAAGAGARAAKAAGRQAKRPGPNAATHPHLARKLAPKRGQQAATAARGRRDKLLASIPPHGVDRRLDDPMAA